MAAVAPGATVTLSLAGAYNAIVRNAATLREAMILQLTMQGLAVSRLTIDADWSYPTRDYTATLHVKPHGATSESAIVGAVLTAAENAGSYTPAITVTSAGEPAQPGPAPGVLGGLIGAVGAAAGNVADLPKDVTRSLNLVVIGIVVLGAFIAFGPNIKSIARAAR